MRSPNSQQTQNMKLETQKKKGISNTAVTGILVKSSCHHELRPSRYQDCNTKGQDVGCYPENSKTRAGPLLMYGVHTERVVFSGS